MVTKSVMDMLAARMEELLGERGPLYTMSEYEARSRIWDLEREKRQERVYICSQYGSKGDMAANLEMARAYCRDVVEEGKIPICPHLFLSGVLDDGMPSKREAGIKIGLELMKDCNELRVFSRLSDEMEGEISAAREQGIPVVVADMGCVYSGEKKTEAEKEIREDLRRYEDGRNARGNKGKT